MMNVSSSGSTASAGSAKPWSTRSALMGSSDDRARHDDHMPTMTDPTTPPRDSVPSFTADPVSDISGGYGGVPPHFVPTGGNLATPPDDDQGLKAPLRKKSKLIPALAGLAMLLAVVGGGAALYMGQQSQDLRQKATGDTSVACTGVELRKMEAGQPENNPSQWTLVSGKSMSIKEGTKYAYKPTGCTAGWVAGIRMSYDANDFLKSGESEWCASNGDYCVRTAVYSASGSKTIYIRSNLKRTMNSIKYWCKHDSTWAQGPVGSDELPTENAPGPGPDYTCSMAGAHATINVQDDTGVISKCYTDKDACTSYNENNCALSTGKYASVNECLSAARAMACNTSSNLNYVSVIPFNPNTGQYDARGYYTTRNGKNYYVAGFRAFRTLPAVTGFTYASLTFQCLTGPNKPFGECDQNRVQSAPITKVFGGSDYVDFEVEREITAQCGGFQSDAYLVDITVDGAKVGCSGNSVGAAYGVCNVSSNQDAQRCPGLPEGWSNVCADVSPSPTPTTTMSCPPESRINLSEPTVALDAQNKLVVSWTAPSPNPSPIEQYIITRVKRPISATTPTPTWAPVESVIGPVPANSSRLTKVGTTLSYTDTTNSATCGFVYRYQLRAYNTTEWNIGQDSLCNVLKQTELSVPCTGESPTPTPTVTPTGAVTSTPTPTPTTTVACNSACVDDAQCKTVNANYVCSIEHGNRCRLEGNRGNTACEGVGATNTPTPVTAIGCNQACVTNSDCSNVSHICYQTGSGAKVCRLDTNVESTTCSSAVAQQPDLPPALPQSGPEDWALWLKAGLVTLGLGAALLLLL